MGVFKAISNIFTGGAVKSIENIAKEWIETDTEKAEATAVMVKTLDPNGLMRRNISDRILSLYAIYIICTMVMLFCEAFALGPVIDGKLAVSVATTKITELFMPITSMVGVIVTASFGVNYANVKKGQ